MLRKPKEMIFSDTQVLKDRWCRYRDSLF